MELLWIYFFKVLIHHQLENKLWVINDIVVVVPNLILLRKIFVFKKGDSLYKGLHFICKNEEISINHLSARPLNLVCTC